MVVQKGDKVQLINEPGTFTVLEVLGATVKVEDEHGFDWEVPLAEILHFSSQGILRKALQNNDQIPHDKVREVGPLAAGRQEKSRVQIEIHEVDLHIHELVERYKHLSNHEIVGIQLRHFKDALEGARMAKVRKLIVIHGVGKGVLRAEIRKELSQTERCAYEDANYLDYGFGATEVSFW
jgi:hypothetical protein